MFNLTIGNLTVDRCKQIKYLQTQCALIDGYTLPIYEEFWPQRIQTSIGTDMFVWEQSTLIAYVGIFFFNPKQPEVILLVTPSRRRQGIAKTLLHQLHKLLAEFAISEYLLLSASSHFDVTLLRHQGHQHHTEIVLQTSDWIIQPVQRQLTLRPANEQDLECLVAIHQNCFNSPEANNRNRFATNLKQNNYFAYVLYQQDIPIAKLHLRANQSETKLYDIGVIPSHQKQGYGFELMQTWHLTFGHHFKFPFVVEIMEDNIAALKLYEKCGFTVSRQLTYWQFNV